MFKHSACMLSLMFAMASPSWAEPPEKKVTSPGSANSALNPAQQKLQQALDDAVAGNTAKVEAVTLHGAGKGEKGGPFDSLSDDEKNKIVADGLQRAHKTAKQQYRLHKPADSLNRLKQTFALISFVELGENPDPDKNADYLDTWIKSLNKAHLSRKDYIAPLNDYGFFLQETARDKQAVTVFEKVVLVDPTREVAYLNLADSLWKLGRQEEAKPLYEKYKKLMKSENLSRKIPSRVDMSLQAQIAPSKSPGKSTGADIDFGPYMAELQRRIKQNWHPPKQDKSIRVVVLFRLDRDGKMDGLKLSSASGKQAVDDAAMKSVQDTSMAPLPPNAPPSVDIQFTFDYNLTRDNQGYALVDRWQKRVKDADSADNHVGLAQAYETVKDYQSAEQEYTKAIEEKPNNIYYKQLLQKCVDKTSSMHHE